MPVCPKCGTDVKHPIKTWSMLSRYSKIGERFKLTLGIFICSRCKRRFRSVVSKEKEQVTLKDMITEIKEVEQELVQILGDLKGKIKKLKDERAELLEEIERLKKAGEEKASTLEKEIVLLREETDNLRDTLGDFK